jgi:type II restriction enzyme
MPPQLWIHLESLMVQNKAHKGNLGEWSELYTLGYLLVHGGAYAADEKQDAMPDMFHKVLQVYLAGRADEPETNYIINPKSIAILVSGNEITRVDRSLIQSSIESMFAELTDGKHKKTFELGTGNELLALIKRTRISASSSERTNDLDLVLEDQVMNVPTPRVGFNIKSQIGGRATLLNASGSTNFVYRIVPDMGANNSSYPEFIHGKHSQNLEALYLSGYHLEFENIVSQVFHQNLTLLDMQFPNYLAKVLLHSYLTGEKTFSQAVQSVFPEGDSDSRQPVFKLKEFLGAVAMGLRPSYEWDGDTTKFSGILVVKDNGEIVFYYLYNRKNFEEHLFNSVAFERPSTSRHKYGEIYSENGVDKIRLNLQIRFKS